jgi:hypothetical protein
MNKMYKGPLNKNSYIKYKGKTYTIPQSLDKCFMGSQPNKVMTIGNRFNDENHKQFVKLPAFAVAIYDTIIGAEGVEDWKLFNKGRVWFQKNFIKEYYVLLD